MPASRIGLLLFAHIRQGNQYELRNGGLSITIYSISKNKARPLYPFPINLA